MRTGCSFQGRVGARPGRCSVHRTASKGCNLNLGIPTKCRPRVATLRNRVSICLGNLWGPHNGQLVFSRKCQCFLYSFCILSFSFIHGFEMIPPTYMRWDEHESSGKCIFGLLVCELVGLAQIHQWDVPSTPSQRIQLWMAVSGFRACWMNELAVAHWKMLKFCPGSTGSKHQKNDIKAYHIKAIISIILRVSIFIPEFEWVAVIVDWCWRYKTRCIDLSASSDPWLGRPWARIGWQHPAQIPPKGPLLTRHWNHYIITEYYGWMCMCVTPAELHGWQLCRRSDAVKHGATYRLTDKPSYRLATILIMHI